MRVVRCGRATRAAAWNAALDAAGAPLVVLHDAALRPLPHLVAYCLDFHARRRGAARAVLLPYGPDVTLRESLLVHWLADEGRFARFPSSEGVYAWPAFAAGAVSCPAALFRHDRFDPSFAAGEDLELAARLSRRGPLEVCYERFQQSTWVRPLDVAAVVRRDYLEMHAAWRRVRADPRAGLSADLDDRARNPERYVLAGGAAARALARSIARLERGLAGLDPRFARGDERRALQVLHGLYFGAVSHAMASGWRDARDGKPPAPAHEVWPG